MSTTEPLTETLTRRPKRADALRNYEKLIEAARDLLDDAGGETSLEEIARRAGVGIGTLYRNFASRQELLEAVYVEEVEALCRSSADFAELEPWDALAGWLHRSVAYLVRKRALAEELLAYLDRDASFFKGCRTAFHGAGEPIFERARAAGVVRPDTSFEDVVQMVAGITKIPGPPEQIHRILDVALDGLRYGAAVAG